MSENTWYKDWFNSPFYHKLYFERDEKEALAFIHNLINHLHPKPASHILDVACGKGRHSKVLAAMGYRVTGIDISPDSIAYAKQFENENLDFFVHDMRLPFWGNYFDFAFNFFTSFGYFKTAREHDDTIRTISQSLKPGGCFVIDYLNVHFAEGHLKPEEKKIIGQTEYAIHRWQDEKHFYKKISVTDPSLNAPFTFTEKVAKFSLGNFTEMLSFQRLQIREVFGDYQFNPYNITTTPRMVIIAQKEMHEKEPKGTAGISS